MAFTSSRGTPRPSSYMRPRIQLASRWPLFGGLEIPNRCLGIVMCFVHFLCLFVFRLALTENHQRGVSAQPSSEPPRGHLHSPSVSRASRPGTLPILATPPLESGTRPAHRAVSDRARVISPVSICSQMTPRAYHVVPGIRVTAGASAAERRKSGVYEPSMDAPRRRACGVVPDLVCSSACLAATPPIPKSATRRAFVPAACGCKRMLAGFRSR